MDNKDINTFKRVDNTHPLDLYMGTDNLSRQTLFLISDIEPPSLISSQIIDVYTGKRKDGRWGVSFSLLDKNFEDIFSRFYGDIIESSRSIKNKDVGANFICNRYIKWQNMLSKSKGELLSSSVIQGLIGELFFLKDYLIPLYGQDFAINSWIGPEKAAQDFVCGNIWYEIKTKNSGAEYVDISSIEQLDVSTNGELIIIYLDKTSSSDNSKITLNKIYKDILNTLKDEELKNKLSEILLNFGYFFRPEYDQPTYKFSKIERYLVNGDFPYIKRDILPNSVINLKYQLSIPLLNNCKIKK